MKSPMISMQSNPCNHCNHSSWHPPIDQPCSLCQGSPFRLEFCLSDRFVARTLLRSAWHPCTVHPAYLVSSSGGNISAPHENCYHLLWKLHWIVEMYLPAHLEDGRSAWTYKTDWGGSPIYFVCLFDPLKAKSYRKEWPGQISFN